MKAKVMYCWPEQLSGDYLAGLTSTPGVSDPGYEKIPVLVIPLTPESVTSLRKTAKRRYWKTLAETGSHVCALEAALAAIGIKPVRPAKQKTKKKV